MGSLVHVVQPRSTRELCDAKWEGSPTDKEDVLLLSAISLLLVCVLLEQPLKQESHDVPCTLAAPPPGAGKPLIRPVHSGRLRI